MACRSPGRIAEAFARFDRGTHEHDLADLLLLERFDGGGDGEIGLAGAGRAAAEHQIVVADRLDVLGLAGGARLNLAAGLADVDRRGATVGRCADDLANDVVDLLGRDGAVAADGGLELFENLGRLEDGRLFAADVDLVVASGNLGRHAVANAAQMLVASAQEQHQLVRGADRDCRFDHSERRRLLATA